MCAYSVDKKIAALRVQHWKKIRTDSQSTIRSIVNPPGKRKEKSNMGNAANFYDALDWIYKSTPEEQKPFMPETAEDIFNEGRLLTVTYNCSNERNVGR